MSIETIARRYSIALADVVVNTGETQTVRAELNDWERLIAENADLLSVFSNPAIAHANKEKILENLIGRVRPSKTSSNFLRILLRNGRLTELREINERFAAELEERSGEVSAEITSARDLHENERAELRSNLEKLTGRQVNIDFQIDRDLIGGVVTRVGSTVYDGSVKTQLNSSCQGPELRGVGSRPPAVEWKEAEWSRIESDWRWLWLSRTRRSPSPK